MWYQTVYAWDIMPHFPPIGLANPGNIVDLSNLHMANSQMYICSMGDWMNKCLRQRSQSYNAEHPQHIWIDSGLQSVTGCKAEMSWLTGWQKKSCPIHSNQETERREDLGIRRHPSKSYFSLVFSKHAALPNSTFSYWTHWWMKPWMNIAPQVSVNLYLR